MLEQLIPVITQTTPTEKILLLAAQTTNRSTESIFTEEPVHTRHPAHYHLLVLVNNQEPRRAEELQDTLEGRCRRLAPVTVIVFSVSIFNNLLAAGHPFAVRISREANIIYDACQVQLARCGKWYDDQYNKKESRNFFQRGEEFIAGAELYAGRNQLSLAVFFLHQVVEHTLTGLIISAIGYRPATHNLGRLISWCNLFTSGPGDIFTSHNEQEAHLFRLLQKAYICGRYRDDYTITETEFSALRQRIRQLKFLTSLQQ